jgi:hypothetical protein
VAHCKEIAFIDRSVSDLDTLLAGLRPEVAPVLIHASEPAPAQIARGLRGQSGLSAIHVIAHGSPGRVTFAAGPLSLATVNERESCASSSAKGRLEQIGEGWLSDR